MNVFICSSTSYITFLGYIFFNEENKFGYIFYICTVIGCFKF